MEDIELDELPARIVADVHPPPKPSVFTPVTQILKTRSMPELWDMEELRDEFEIEFIYQIVQPYDDVVDELHEVMEDAIKTVNVAVHQSDDDAIQKTGIQNEEIESPQVDEDDMYYDRIEYVNEIKDVQNEGNVQIIRKVQSAPMLRNVSAPSLRKVSPEKESNDENNIRDDDELTRTFNWVFGTSITLLVLRILYELW